MLTVRLKQGRWQGFTSAARPCWRLTRDQVATTEPGLPFNHRPNHVVSASLALGNGHSSGLPTLSKHYPPPEAIPRAKHISPIKNRRQQGWQSINNS